MEVESAEMKDASHGRMKQVKMGSLMEWCGVDTRMDKDVGKMK